MILARASAANPIAKDKLAKRRPNVANRLDATIPSASELAHSFENSSFVLSLSSSVGGIESVSKSWSKNSDCRQRSSIIYANARDHVREANYRVSRRPSIAKLIGLLPLERSLFPEHVSPAQFASGAALAENNAGLLIRPG